MTTKTPEEQAVEYLKDTITGNERNLKTFRERFEKNPGYAFEWSESAMKAVAYIETANWLLDNWLLEQHTSGEIEKAKDLTWVVKNLRRVAMEHSRFPSASTSVTSNLMAQYRLAAKSDIYNELSFFVRDVRD